MAFNLTNPYDFGPCLAELYDADESETADLALIRKLLGTRQALRVLEPFVGTGRLLIPLAQDGHEAVGLDQAQAMLARAEARVAQLPVNVRQRIRLVQQDVFAEQWPRPFDLVILGGNCLYELATPAEQAELFRRTAKALQPGGYVFVDNDHMEGTLDPAWQVADARPSFPTGSCRDGTQVRSWIETIWYDAPARLVRFRRTVEITPPDAPRRKYVYIQQKHPVSTAEVAAWLQENGFRIEAMFGDRSGSPYTQESSRAIFWARLER